MFVDRVAFEPVPAYARVDAEVLAKVRAQLLGESDTFTGTLDHAFRALERRHPAVASFVAHDLAAIDHPGAQGVGFFLALLIVLAFEEAFGRRLAAVELADLQLALDRLIADGELRGASTSSRFYSEDAVALGQPAIVALLRRELDAVLDSAGEDPAVASALDRFYETLLVLTVAFTQAVGPEPSLNRRRTAADACE